MTERVLPGGYPDLRLVADDSVLPLRLANINGRESMPVVFTPEPAAGLVRRTARGGISAGAVRFTFGAPAR